jgi:hypothetical protein
MSRSVQAMINLGMPERRGLEGAKVGLSEVAVDSEDLAGSGEGAHLLAVTHFKISLGKFLVIFSEVELEVDLGVFLRNLELVKGQIYAIPST